MKNIQVASHMFMAVRLDTTGKLDRNLAKEMTGVINKNIDRYVSLESIELKV